MRISKLERAVLIVTAITLIAMFFYFMGSQSVDAPVTVMTRETLPPSASETPVSGSPTEEMPVLDTASMQSGEVPETASPAVSSSPESSGPVPAEESSFPININNATAAELMLLPGIGEVRAEAIVTERNKNGPFQYIEDITRVKGIGNGIFQSIAEYITV